MIVAADILPGRADFANVTRKSFEFCFHVVKKERFHILGLGPGGERANRGLGGCDPMILPGIDLGSRPLGLP